MPIINIFCLKQILFVALRFEDLYQFSISFMSTNLIDEFKEILGGQLFYKNTFTNWVCYIDYGHFNIPKLLQYNLQW